SEDRIDSLIVADRTTRQRTVRAQFFILALGGIETPRLLLHSDPTGPGLGNRRDQLGRFYACHFENILARLVAEPGVRIPFDFERTQDGVYCRRKLQFSPQS